MKAVMISIQPKWCAKIANGEKTIEIRKTKPNIDVPFKCYIYCTKNKDRYFLQKKDNRFCEIASKVYTKKEYEENFADKILNGKVIGEFTCEKIEKIDCAVAPYLKENNLGYEKFLDNGVYKNNKPCSMHFDGIVFERQDKNIDTMLKNEDFSKMQINPQEVFDYIGGYGKVMYLWQISDLKIYDRPKELRGFKTPPCEKSENACGNCKWLDVNDTPNGREVECYVDNGKPLCRPPQSWCYVEELK